MLDLLQYVQGGDRHKLGEMMATGSATAQARLSSGDRVTEQAAEPMPITIVASDDRDELSILAGDGSVLGVVVARDHAGVEAVLDSGLLLDFSLHGTTVAMTRAAAGQLSFT